MERRVGCRLNRLCALVLALALGAPTAGVARASDRCQRYRDLAGNRTERPADALPGSGRLRVFAIQYKQLVDYVESYATFADKMECLLIDYVLPYRHPGKVELVVFNEDIGLATLATGSRGAPARAWASLPAPGNTPATYNASGVPLGAAVALGLVARGYAKELAVYRARFPDQDARKAVLTAATDTFVRAFMATFSRLARRYDLYIVAGNNQGNFSFSTDPADIAAFSDPDLAEYYEDGSATGVWVADDARVWNQAFMFGPRSVRPPEQGASADPNSHDYDPRTNLLFANKKTPLTQLEKDFLALDEGGMGRANTGPFRIAELPGFRFGFAISLPAFMYGDDVLGAPCASSLSWMRCLDHRGVNTVIQPEANPGPWARYGADGGNWQALTWGASTLRAVTDPSVGFAYVICPHMVGNLIDIPFDGQSAITMRARRGPGRHYVGAGDFIAGTDPPWTRPYAGDHPEFLALAPWVLNDDPLLSPQDNRARLQERAEAMQAGSLSEHENGYLETAIWADLATPR